MFTFLLKKIRLIITSAKCCVEYKCEYWVNYVDEHVKMYEFLLCSRIVSISEDKCADILSVVND